MSRPSHDPAGGETPSSLPASGPAPSAGAEGGCESPPGLPAAPRTAAVIPPFAVAVRGTPETPPGGARPHAAPPGGSTWEIELPAGLKLLSLNGREHYMVRNRTYQSLKKAAWAMTVNARVPRLERVEITAVYDPPDRRQRDPDNLAASLKPCVDALVAARVIPNDDSRYVAGVSCEIGERIYPRGRLRLIIREVAAVPPGGAV